MSNENNSSAPLLPCPFCGASARGYEIEPHQHSAALLALVPNMPKEHQGSYVIEGDCQCGSGLIGDNLAEVTARWNARAPQAVAAQAAPAAVAVTDAQIDAILDEPGGMIFYVSDQRQKQHLFARRVLALATPALPATEESSAGEQAEASHQTKLLAQALGDCILASGIVRSDLDMSGPQLLMFAEDLKELLLAGQAEVQAEPVANCYSDDNGDTWRDCPDDSDFVEGRQLGEEFELQASIRSWSETFRVTKVPDETSDDYEVEPVSVRTAPQAQPADALDAIQNPQEMADWLIAMRSRIGSCREASQAWSEEIGIKSWDNYTVLSEVFAAMAAAQEGGAA